MPQMSNFRTDKLKMMQEHQMEGGAHPAHPHKQIINNSLTCVENWEVSPLRVFFQSPIYIYFFILFYFILSLIKMFTTSRYILFCLFIRILEYFLTIFFPSHVLMF